VRKCPVQLFEIFFPAEGNPFLFLFFYCPNNWPKRVVGFFFKRELQKRKSLIIGKNMFKNTLKIKYVQRNAMGWVDEESMLFRGANHLLVTWLSGLAAGKTGVTRPLPRCSPQAFSYDVSVKREIV
jgi:hypothetical protein